MASITKRANGRYVVRWREYKGAPEQSKHFAKKVDADAYRAKIENELNTGAYVNPRTAQQTTFGEFAQRWFRLQTWRASSFDRQRSVYDKHIAPTFADRPIGSIRRTECQQWALGLKLAPTTVEGAGRLLAAILRSAVDDRVIATNPAERLKYPQGADDTTTPPLTIAEVEKLAAAAMPELRVPILFAACSGLRQGELFGLTHDRVGWLRREVTIDQQLLTPSTGGVVLSPKLKTKRSRRTVPIHDYALEQLSAHVAQFGQGEGGYLFVNREGRPWRRNTATAGLHRAAKGASLEVSGWHALRRHAASVLIHQGLSVTAVAATLGHTPEECLRTYAGWWPSEDDQIRSAWASAWDDSQRRAVLTRSSDGQT